MMSPHSSTIGQSHECMQRPLSGLRRSWYALVAAALVAVVALLAACTVGGSATTNAGQSSAPTATATTAPTPTAKPKPASVPTTSVAYCQGLLSLTEANSIMNPPAPATSILFENDSSNNLNACSWVPGQGVAVLAVFFAPFPQGTSLNAAAQQQLAKAHVPPGSSLTTTPVSGVGDQALYISATVGTPAGPNYIAALDVADGSVLLACDQTGAGSVPTVAQSELTQACKMVVSRL